MRAVISEHALNELKETVGGSDAPEPGPAINDYSYFSKAPPEPLIHPNHSAQMANVTPLPDLPTRFTRESHEEISANVASPSSSASVGIKPQQLCLYGKQSAHTLEIRTHRRGEDFLGVHVVTIDSAHALPGGGGFDWKNKLVLQLTPEEMPGIIATLIGITASVKFGNHGPDRSKFIELRRQDGGIVFVTGEPGISFSVPVRTAPLYYVHDLFCRAMDEPLHDMEVKLVFDENMLVHDVAAFTTSAPYADCFVAGSALQTIKGLHISGGWSQEVSRRLGGTQSCTHLMQLLIPLGTTAFQSLTMVRMDRPAALKADGKPVKVDSCYAYAAERGVVMHKLT